MSRIVVDTGFLVALYIKRDASHEQAVQFLKTNRSSLVTAAPVISEACYFLSAAGKTELLRWAQQGGMQVDDVPAMAYPILARHIDRYADRDMDFTDAALLWLADEKRERSILTVDEHDFGVYRLRGNKRFEVIDWR